MVRGSVSLNWLMAPSVLLLPLNPSCSPLSRPSFAPKYSRRPWVAIWSSVDCDPVSGVTPVGPIGWSLAPYWGMRAIRAAARPAQLTTTAACTT